MYFYLCRKVLTARQSRRRNGTPGDFNDFVIKIFKSVQFVGMYYDQYVKQKWFMAKDLGRLEISRPSE